MAPTVDSAHYSLCAARIVYERGSNPAGALIW